MPAIARPLLWTLTQGAFWSGTRLSPARPAMTKFDNCSSRHWAMCPLRRAFHRREGAEKIRGQIRNRVGLTVLPEVLPIFPELKMLSSALSTSRSEEHTSELQSLRH